MKILLLANNVLDINTLNQGIAIVKQWTATINLELDFTIRNTTKQFTSVPFSNETAVNGYAIDSVQIFQEGKATGIPFDVVCLVFDATKISPSPTNPMDLGQDIQISIQWYAGHPEVFAEFFLHELSHYFFSTSTKKDLTHLKYDPMWNGEWNQLSNQAYYLFLLKAFVSPVASVVITRTTSDSKETLGQLRTTDGQFGCYTLELPDLNNQRNISCIPKGTYSVIWVITPHFPNGVYQIQNVLNRDGIDIHSGTSFKDTDGCILLGGLLEDINHDGITDIVNSQLILTAFEKKFNKLPFILQIL